MLLAAPSFPSLPFEAPLSVLSLSLSSSKLELARDSLHVGDDADERARASVLEDETRISIMQNYPFAERTEGGGRE